MEGVGTETRMDQVLLLGLGLALGAGFGIVLQLLVQLHQQHDRDPQQARVWVVSGLQLHVQLAVLVVECDGYWHRASGSCSG